MNDRDCSPLDDYMWPGKAEITTRSAAELGSVKTDTGSQVFPSLILTSNFIFRTEERHLGQPFLDKEDFAFLTTVASAKGEDCILGSAGARKRWDIYTRNVKLRHCAWGQYPIPM